MEALQREVGVFVTNRAKEANALENARDAEAAPAKRVALDQDLNHLGFRGGRLVLSQAVAAWSVSRRCYAASLAPLFMWS
ncbi:hemagglutinin-related protein [Pandoraea terrae]|uniref:Hemagglutinin-related protein n=1 Tax=Pandoraea terrae TaxID=1537710 RepID=A0A5E4YG98_9BURK|nr:hypothetical protein [Pandoraea terrae]VVE47482.1 hemagglutinin-related protein [Pandoraea terrae]